MMWPWRRKPTKKDPHEPLLDDQLAVEFIKGAYGLMPGQTPRFDLKDPTQTALRRIRDWVRMAEADAINEDPSRRPRRRTGLAQERADDAS
jgi:hypothetical protein